MPQQAAQNQTELSALTSTLWRHVKTGGVYVISGGVYVISGECQIEATNEPAVLYQSVQTQGPLWCRPKSEFLDGRFVKQGVS